MSPRLTVVLLVFVFFASSGMKLLLKDGNFIEVTDYRSAPGTVYFDKGGRTFALPEAIVDKESTRRLREFESKKISVLKLHSSILSSRPAQAFGGHRKSAEEKTPVQRSGIRIETRKETNPFFLEPATEHADDDVIDGLKRKGVIFKFDLPVRK